MKPTPMFARNDVITNDINQADETVWRKLNCAGQQSKPKFCGVPQGRVLDYWFSCSTGDDQRHGFLEH